MTDIYSSGINYYGIYNQCYHAPKGRVARSLDLLFRNSPTAHSGRDKAPALQESVPCIDSAGGITYFNRADVREALHIPKAAQQEQWSICSDILKYNITTQTTKSYVQELMANDVYVVYYNGDTDLACNFLGDEQFVDAFNRPVVHKRSSWKVAGQIAGFVKVFDKIAFVTVRGAGHMVPQDKPLEAFVMLNAILNGKQLEL